MLILGSKRGKGGLWKGALQGCEMGTDSFNKGTLIFNCTDSFINGTLIFKGTDRFNKDTLISMMHSYDLWKWYYSMHMCLNIG